ncbi:MAG: helix-turn-helix domain-containing protein [Porphyrobacter sp.]|nr:helix-turn-helix domain-containing protein [Porphyrobacter sp.]
MDSDNHDSADTAPPAGVAGPGASLRAAREAQRLELAHIAAETRIPLRHLEAIEDDNFESLPSRAYAIGFTRTYAKALGLDEVGIVDAVRAELADGAMRRAVPAGGMEPGDPARLPSAGLAWAAAGAVVILAAGIFAFYNSYFGAGEVPGPLLSPEPSPTAVSAAPAPAAAGAGATSGPVVLTALEDGIWVRLYEEGGERLTERTLKVGETLEVPASARDPRINTGRPDALSVTIGGQQVAKLSDRPATISGVPVSAAALAARGAATPAATATPALTGVGAQEAPRAAAPRRVTAPPAARPAAESEAPAAAPVSAPAPAPETAAAPGR